MITRFEDLPRIPEAELTGNFDTVADRADTQPVVIVRDGQESLVLLSAATYSRLKRGEGQVSTPVDLSDDWTA